MMLLQGRADTGFEDGGFNLVLKSDTGGATTLHCNRIEGNILSFDSFLSLFVDSSIE